jgi:hypothetical protein
MSGPAEEEASQRRVERVWTGVWGSKAPVRPLLLFCGLKGERDENELDDEGGMIDVVVIA